MASLQLADLATGDAHLPAATVFMMGGVAEQHRRRVQRLLKRLPDELPRTEGRAWRELRDLMELRRAEAEAARPPVRATLRAGPDRHPRTNRSRYPAPVPHGRPSFPGAGAHASLPPAPQSGQRESAESSPMTTRGCSVTMKCSWSVSRKFPMSVQMSGKSGSAMWAR